MAIENILNSNMPIDVVVAWVNGEDPAHREKMRSYLNDSAKLSEAAKHPTRFNSVGEINYCIRSVFTFAPFVRNVFIVTDNQVPDIEGDIKKYFPERWQDLKIIDHRIIFEGYEQFLPTFNSISIASMLWRIPGLAEQFVYFNDDVILIRPVKPQDWFIQGNPVLRGQWAMPPRLRIAWDAIRTFYHRNILSHIRYQPGPSFQIYQWQSARMLGFRNRYFRHGHTPIPFNPAKTRDFFKSNPDKLAKNIACRFREKEQFTIGSLANHLEIKAGNKNFKPMNTVYFQPYNRKNGYLNRKVRECQDPSVQWICVQSLDRCPSQIRQELFDWLESLLIPE
ncbi:MAG TPA: Stealth CR1 domain-containing protein [Saprospiraceae bacterium]|nr:Stealth CR1 domain-containing protein [Saprospiraceae bacterium]